MTARAILRAVAALSLTFALATAPAEASNKRRASEKAGRCAAAHAMAKKALKAKTAADAGFVVLPHPSGKVAISPRDSDGKYTRTVVVKAGGSYTQLLDAQGAVIDTYSDGVPESAIL